MMARDVTGMGNGRDMPTDGIAGDDLKMRATETGFGATTQDVDAGYLTIANADTDSRIGVLPMPTRKITEVDGPPPIDTMPEGFLPRPSIAIDR
jgi:hypothetical protein